MPVRSIFTSSYNPNKDFITTKLDIVDQSEWKNRSLIEKVRDWLKGVSCDKVKVAQKLFYTLSTQDLTPSVNVSMNEMLDALRHKITKPHLPNSSSRADFKTAGFWLEKAIHAVIANISFLIG